MDYNSLSLPELKALVKERGIKGTSTMRKPELIEVLEANDKSAKPAVKTENVKPAAKKEGKKPEAKSEGEKTSEKTESAKPAPKAGRPRKAKPADESVSEKPKNETAEKENGVSERQVRPVRRPDGNAAVRHPDGNADARRPDGSVPVRRADGTVLYRRPDGTLVRRVQKRPDGAVQTTPQNTPQTSSHIAQQTAQQTAPQSQAETAPAQPRPVQETEAPVTPEMLDSGISREGVLELVKNEGYGFMRCDNYLPGERDVYVSPSQINRLKLKTGDLIKGNLKIATGNEKYQGLAFIESVNGVAPESIRQRPRFEDLTPVFPHERIHLETPRCTPAMRIVDIISPVGKGQRGMIVAQPKAGKTTLLKQIANAIKINHPEMHIIILLIDERPEEVTDMKESINGKNVEVIYSTFDELPDNHKRVSEMVIERARRLVEHGQDVCILLDSITRLARAYNLTVVNSGKTLSGGLDPAALYMPKKFFGAARCMREGGSLTILATALVETGSRMDDVVFEEFKGTGNMELVLDRSLSERRIFPAIDLPKSGTRRDDLLLTPEEYEANFLMRTAFNGSKADEAIEIILNLVRATRNNEEFIETIRKRGIFG